MLGLHAATWSSSVVEVTGPVDEQQRIDSLDVLRGFALLGILLMNIIGFGFVAAAYTAPKLAIDGPLDLAAWFMTELLAEGSMRTLFSLLFGAGVVLFLGRAREGRGVLHFKRTFWLLMFGLIDGYLLLWTGDILVTYALAGFVLYFVRDVSGKKLLVSASVLILLLSLYNAAMYAGLSQTGAAASQAQSLQQQGAEVPSELAELGRFWQEFSADFDPSESQVADELRARRDSYASALAWTASHNTEIIRSSVLPIMLPDALVVMLLGMALFKYGVLQGQLSRSFYLRMSVIGFSVGFAINLFEIWRAYSSDFLLLPAFNVLQPSYHIGRIALALGWLGMIVRMHQSLGFGRRLAAVGRMALTNYLMHSAICLFVFTGAGLGLVGEFARWQLYAVVIVIWLVQLSLSPWWLQRYHYGPVEWVWRMLTYGAGAKFARGQLDR